MRELHHLASARKRALPGAHIPQFSPCGLLGLEFVSFCLLIRLEPGRLFLSFDSSGFDSMSMALEAPLSLLDYHEEAVLL